MTLQLYATTSEMSRGGREVREVEETFHFERVAVFKYSMSTICIVISTAGVADIDHNDCVFIEEDQASCASTRFPVYSLPSGNTKRSDGRF